MRTKVLICNDFELLPRKGGPSTYLWNLRQFLEAESIPDIKFLDYYAREPIATDKTKAGWKTYGKWLANARAISAFYVNIKGDVIDKPELLEGYDILHFHSTRSLYRFRHAIEKLSKKPVILLQSHCPSIFHRELLEEWFKLTPEMTFRLTVNTVAEIDRYAFTKADYLLFPCDEAREPYRRTWKDFDNITRDGKFLYLPTGTTPANIKQEKAAIRKQFNLPEDAFVVCFAGRHNRIKGYDVLKEAAEYIGETQKNIYFLVAGAVTPLTPPESRRWIEVGWTNDPHSIIAAADCFVLPNRETYFDLILLEVLSLGKRMILSNTGGNKFFKRFDSPGIDYFNSEDAIMLAQKIMAMSSAQDAAIINKVEDFNRSLFHDHFSLNYFGNAYINLINSI